jgi:hypothetical protein
MPFCPKCGVETIEQCPSCSEQVNGYFGDPNNGIVLDHDELDAFCPYCGNAYPWTGQRISAAHELAQQLDMLSPEERIALDGTIDDLVRDTSAALPAAHRFKLLVAKAGYQVPEYFKEILLHTVSAKIAQLIWGSA